MKLKKIVKLLAVSSSIILISACSAKHKNMNENTVADANGVETSGVGQTAQFGGEGSGAGTIHAKAGNTFYFDYDKSEIREADKPAILAHADRLVSNPNAKIIVEGHTDPRGSREYNIALGERRAKAVDELLQTKGVNGSQARIVSYGAERPAADGKSEQDYQLDRRAIISQK
jgi:peptidoglycan-associated lipoprotein